MILPIKNIHRFVTKIFKQPGYAFMVIVKRIMAYLAYYIGKGIAPMPESITLFLTSRCNLRCKMCGQWGEHGTSKNLKNNDFAKELDPDQLRKFIDSVAKFKPSITLFGGEPLLHPGCVDLIKHIKRNKMHCLMITNGSLLNRYAKPLVEAGLDELNISLDGGQQLHDSIRGMSGLFSLITAGIKEVNSAKQQSGLSKPLINLQCTITSFNYHYLEQLIAVAKELKVNSLTFHNLIFLDQEIMDCQKQIDQQLNNSSYSWQGFVFEPGIDPNKLYEKIKSLISQPYSFSVDLYPNLSLKEMTRYYTEKKYIPKEYPSRCVSPWLVGYVFADGEVRPCLNNTYSFGNILKDQFRSIWNSACAVNYRQQLKKLKIFPACVRCTELYRY